MRTRSTSADANRDVGLVGIRCAGVWGPLPKLLRSPPMSPRLSIAHGSPGASSRRADSPAVWGFLVFPQTCRNWHWDETVGTVCIPIGRDVDGAWHPCAAVPPLGRMKLSIKFFIWVLRNRRLRRPPSTLFAWRLPVL